jgi:phosphatidylserine decarboxylase
MTGRTEREVSGRAGHPPALLEAERFYLARWGLREIRLAALATASAVLLVLIPALAHSLQWLWLLAPVLATGAFLVLFFRSPRRFPTSEQGVLLAPADGKVVDAGAVDEPEYIGGPAHRVGIFLSIFDVHVNRAPCSGKVEFVRHRSGRYLDARDPRSIRENESRATGLVASEPGYEGRRVLVHQIAGAIARRIVGPLEKGQSVERGRLIGMIKYGSRTELYVSTPPGEAPPEVQVKVGDRVRGGETVLYRYGRRPVDSGGAGA